MWQLQVVLVFQAHAGGHIFDPGPAALDRVITKTTDYDKNKFIFVRCITRNPMYAAKPDCGDCKSSLDSGQQ